jgi:hypothetical protein
MCTFLYFALYKRQNMVIQKHLMGSELSETDK